MEEDVPGACVRFLHGPGLNLFSISPLGTSDAVLPWCPLLGLAAIAGYLLTGHAAALFAAWVLHLMLSASCGMGWPWHSLANEALFLFNVCGVSVDGIWTGSPRDSENKATRWFLPTLAFRFLLFRLIFGFGKFKFAKSTRADWMYIKSFLIGMPIPGYLGVLAYRHLPNVCFVVGYLFFFVSEIVAPFFYFCTNPIVRLAAAVFSAALMLGIAVTGNFGNFNLLTASLCGLLMLPVFGVSPPGVALTLFEWTSVRDWVLVTYVLSGTVLLPFNSWVTSSWHMWPALRAISPIAKYLCDFFEVASEWRLLHAYGIFPPKLFPAARNMYLFEGSRDGGKTWLPYHYRHQPTQPNDAPAFIPLLHPMLDFLAFYQFFSGFEQSVFEGTDPARNVHNRLIIAVARSLLKGGPGSVMSLFSPIELPFGGATPGHVRVAQLLLQPTMKGESAWWTVHRGQIEQPPVSLRTDEADPLPTPVVQDFLAECDPAAAVWRDRAVRDPREAATRLSASPWSHRWRASTQDQPRGEGDFNAFVVRHFGYDGAGPSAAERAIGEAAIGSSSVAAAATAHARLRQQLGNAGWTDAYRAVNRRALSLLDTVWFVVQSLLLVEQGMSHFDIYLFALAAVVDPAGTVPRGVRTERELRECIQRYRTPVDTGDVHGPTTPRGTALGARVFVLLNATTLRANVSVMRRMTETVAMKSTPEDEKVLPGYTAFASRVLLDGLPFEQRRLAPQNDHSSSSPVLGPQAPLDRYGEEVVWKFAFDAMAGVPLFVSTRRGGDDTTTTT